MGLDHQLDLRLLVAGQVIGGPVHSRQILENARLVTPIPPVGRCDRARAAGPLVGLKQDNQLVWLREWQWPDNPRVHVTENGRVGADAQCKGDNRHQSKAGALG